MQQFRSYVVAGVVIAAVVACVAWVVSAQPGAFPGLQTVGPYKYKAVPVGANGPLKECVVCHSIDSWRAAARGAAGLHGIVGAHKARYAWYAYSDALRKAGGTWTEADLDNFLASPSKVLAGHLEDHPRLSRPQAARRYYCRPEEDPVISL